MKFMLVVFFTKECLNDTCTFPFIIVTHWMMAMFNYNAYLTFLFIPTTLNLDHTRGTVSTLLTYLSLK